MSLPAGEYRCSKCSYTKPRFHNPVTLRYPMSDGGYVTGYRKSRWCAVCDDVRDCESLPSAVELQNRLSEADHIEVQPVMQESAWRRWLHLGEKPTPAPQPKMNAETKTEIRRTLRWLAERQSRARCLECGTEQPARKAHEAGQLIHSCGGVLEEITENPGVRASFVPTRHIMSLEGLVLRTERDDGK